MPSQYIVEHWLLKHARFRDKSLTTSQISQAYARLGFASAGLLYLMLHAADFSSYKVAYLISGTLYFLNNLISIPMIRRQPLSAFRCLFFPMFDIAIVSFSMLIDGGQSSGLFFLFLVIIIGNGLRFGNTFLLYTQFLCMVGMAAILTYSHFLLQMDIDYSVLLWQLVSLLAIPYYVFLIGKQAEDALKGQEEAEKSAYHLLNKGPLPVFTFELDRQNTPRILYANSAVAETFQSSSKFDPVGQCADTLVLPEDSPEMISFCRDTFKPESEQNNAETLFIRSRNASGKVLKLMCNATCIRWRQRWVGVCFMLDISARETMRDEMESIHRQGYMTTLVAGIVHDFRNVLTNMIGYAEVLQMSTSDESSKQPLNAIIAAGDRGSELVTHLLKLSKNGETDDLPAYTEGNLIMQPLENIMGLARLQMPQNIKLNCQIDKHLHDVAISMVEIEQILMNLVNNAMQAMRKKGQIHVRVSNDARHPLSKPGHPCLCVRVADNGVGIDKTDLDAVFKPFWTSKGGRGGTGLGLTMVQRIVKRHHGSIEVESEPDKETRFTIHLPPHIQDAANTGSAKNGTMSNADDQSAQPTADISNCHVLLVDDEPDILNIHQAMLGHLQHTSIKAENGRQALEIFLNDSQHIDLIITDFRMPVMDGLELVETIRKKGFNIPILMITAFGEDRHLQRVIDYHVTLINKPVSMKKFRHAIAETMAPKP